VIILEEQELRRTLSRLACYFVTGPEHVLYQYLSEYAGDLERKTQFDCSKELAAFSASLLGYMSGREMPLVYGRDMTFLRAFDKVLKSKILDRRADGNSEFSLLLKQLMQFEEEDDWEIFEGVLGDNFGLLSSMILQPAVANAA